MGERAKKKAAMSVQQGVKNKNNLHGDFLFLLHDVAGQQVWFNHESGKGAALAGVVGAREQVKASFHLGQELEPPLRP